MPRLSPCIFSCKSTWFALSLRIAILMPLIVATSARGSEEPDLVLSVGESRDIKMSIPWNPPVPPGTLITQVVSITASPEGIVSLEPSTPISTTDGKVSVSATGVASGEATLYPNNLPYTNLSVVVAYAHASIVDSGCYYLEENKLYKGLCAATNISGSYGTLIVSITPRDQEATLKINGHGYPFENGIAYKPLDSSEPQEVVVHVSGHQIYEETLTPTMGCHVNESSCCGCETCGKEPGDIDADNGCALVIMKLGWSDARNSNGQLVYHKPTGPLGLDRSDFKLIAPASTHAEYDSVGRLTAVSTATHRFVIVDMANGLRIDVTNSTQELVAQCTLVNPGGNHNSLMIDGGRLGEARHFGFTWDPALGALSFRKGAADDADRVIETMTVYTNEFDTLAIDRRVTDANGTLMSFMTTEYTDLGGVRLPAREIPHRYAEPNETDILYGSRMIYHANTNHPGAYRKLASRMRYYWDSNAEYQEYESEGYEYDEKGRVIMQRAIWRSSGTQQTTNSFTPVAGSGDTGVIEPDALRRVVKTVDGTEIERNYTVYLAVPGQPCQYQVVNERAASAGAAFGATGNLRDETVYWWTNAPAHLAGRPVYALGADSNRTSYAYERGFLAVSNNSANPGASTMTYTSEPTGIAVLRTIAIHGTAAHAGGIPGQTAIDVTVTDLDWGHTYISEQYVRTQSENLTDPDNLVDRTLTFFDARRHPILILNADGTYSESTWGCCGQESETGRDGIANDFLYGGQQRLVQRSDSGPSYLPGSPGGITTTYKYDPLGRTISTTRFAPLQSSLISTTSFNDLIGNDTTVIDEFGVTHGTSVFHYQGDHHNLELWEVDDICTRRFLALDDSVLWVDTYSQDHANMRVKQSDICGNYDAQGRLYKTVYECGVWCSMQEYYSWYTMWPGYAWGYYSGYYETSLSDFLGRAIYESVPAFNGTQRETFHSYDAAGRLNATTVQAGSSVLERTLRQYDLLGNLALTCQDLDLDGQIDLNGPDRVSGQFAYYEYRDAEVLHGQEVAAGWWRVSGSTVYPEVNGSTPLTNGLNRTRLSALCQAGAYGLLTAETVSLDPLENVTLSREFLDRDAHRTVRWTRYPDSDQPEIAFLIAGHTVSNITRSGVVTHYEYDAFGRQTAAWSQSWNGARTVATYTHYNNKGQVDWTEDAAGKRTSYAYDDRGRRTSTTDAMNQATHTAYTGDGRVLATWGATYPVAYEYDPWGRMTAMATTRAPEHANRNLWELLDEEMLLSDTDDPAYPSALDTTRWHYDLPTGLLTNKVYADGNGTAYAYTPGGKLATRTWERGVTTEYSYDAAGALTSIVYSDGTPGVAFQYDRLGRQVLAATAGVSTNLYGYNLYGHLTNETVSHCASAPLRETITRSYDSLGRESDFSLGADYEVVYGYDDFGRFHSVSSTVAAAKSKATYAYLEGSGLLAAMTNSWGFSWTRAFEPQRNLIASVENRFGESLISTFDYANDSLARRTRRVDNQIMTNDFGYNLRSEVIGALMGTNQYVYAYDPIGNRLTATNNAEGWSYLSNPLNQYTNIADGVIVEPEYDADGNMTATGDGWRYIWNGENRMILASNSQYIVTYAYDHQGRMVSKTVNGSVRQYFWDGYNIVRSLTHSQTHTLTNSFIWGLDLSGSLQGAGGVGGLLAEIQDGEPYYATYDANGNVTEYISTNGVTEAHYEYSPFGEIVVQSGDLADSFTHRFSTKPWCGVTELSEYLFRKYEPGMGRWLSRDPIGELGGANIYMAMANDIVNRFDPDGRSVDEGLSPSWVDLVTAYRTAKEKFGNSAGIFYRAAFIQNMFAKLEETARWLAKGDWVFESEFLGPAYIPGVGMAWNSKDKNRDLAALHELTHATRMKLVAGNPYNEEGIAYSMNVFYQGAQSFVFFDKLINAASSTLMNDEKYASVLRENWQAAWSLINYNDKDSVSFGGLVKDKIKQNHWISFEETFNIDLSCKRLARIYNAYLKASGKCIRLSCDSSTSSSGPNIMVVAGRNIPIGQQ